MVWHRFGLNRYDGVQFKVYGYNPQDSTSLPSYQVTTMCVDSSGELWVGTVNNGIAKFNRDLDNFTRYQHISGDDNSLINDHITALFADSDNKIWIGTDKGLSRFDPENRSFISFLHDPEDTTTLIDDHILSISEIPSGTLWIGTFEASLIKMNLHDFSINNVLKRPRHIGISSGFETRCLYADHRNNVLWFGQFADGLYKYYPNSGGLVFYCSPKGQDRSHIEGVYSLALAQDGNLWLGTVGGVTSFDPVTETFEYHLADKHDPTALNDNLAYTVYIDHNNILWVGTESGGVNKYDPGLLRFQHFRNEPGNPNSLRADMVFDIKKDMLGNLWFATLPGGTSCLNVNTGKFHHYYSIDNTRTIWSRNYIASVLPLLSGRVWIGTFQCGLFDMDPVSSHFEHYLKIPGNSNSISDNDVYAMLETKSGALWIGTKSGGLNRFDRESQKFTRYQNYPDNPQSISSNFIYDILEDHAGAIWIATADGGLNRYNQHTDDFTRFMVSRDKANSISSNCILDLYEDEKNNIWIGTRSGGLNKLDPDRNRFSQVDLEILPQDLAVFGILQDDNYFLWLSTNHGICKVHSDSGLVNRYTTDDGVLEEFYYKSCAKDDYGRMYFGGVNGYNRFHPDSIRDNLVIPPVVMTGLEVNYKPVRIGKEVNGRIILTKAINETKKLTFYYPHKVITFQFAALNYRASHKNRYAYRLEGLQENWIDCGTERSAQFMNLPPGHFTFQVRGSNNDGVWNITGTSIQMTIKPPFWKTIWFRFLIILIILTIVLIYIRLRMNRIREKHKAVTMRVELDQLRRELLSKSMYLKEKQQIIDNFSEELNSVLKTNPDEVQNKVKKTIRKYSDTTATDQAWQEFESWFAQVHTGFYQKLHQTYPDLSPIELKVCALLRLNLVSKDMANLMNVKPSSVDMYRYRIRKKLNLQQDDNLTSFLIQF